MMTNIEHSATIFAALSDPIRLRIIEELSRQPRYVSELCCLLNKKQSYVSKQLQKLQAARLVSCEQKGKAYSLKREGFSEAENELRGIAPRRSRQGIA